MAKTQTEIINTLITKQLELGGYQITYDEIVEQYEVKIFLAHQRGERFEWYKLYTITVQQNKDWYVWAAKWVAKELKYSKKQAFMQVAMLDLQIGLMIKG